MNGNNKIIWFDGEMTGLDPENSYFLEVACMITDNDLNIIANGPNIVIHQPDNILTNMDDWCLQQHHQSGLIDSSLNSKVTVKDAEDELLNFVRPLTIPGQCPLAGNSVYMDKLFLLKYMPTFANHLHYRLIDVSSIKLLANMWYGVTVEKKVAHRAPSDILESIKELKFYREKIFIPSLENNKNKKEKGNCSNC